MSMDPPRQRFRLILSYDGTDFHGWQEQPGERTVEGCLREALARLGAEPIETASASRTDTGVHALGQSVMAELSTRLPPEEMGRALEALTPPDLSVRECRSATVDFHPRFDALEKRYLYRIHTAPLRSPFGSRYQWCLAEPFDLARLNEASRRLEGEHDFAAFRNRSKDEPSETVRTLRRLEWRREGPHLFFQVIGRGFLYRMVRNLVGTLLDVGRGKLQPPDIARILASGDRGQAGTTAPPQGLFLMEVSYADTRECALDERPPLF